MGFCGGMEITHRHSCCLSVCVRVRVRVIVCGDRALAGDLPTLGDAGWGLSWNPTGTPGSGVAGLQTPGEEAGAEWGAGTHMGGALAQGHPVESTPPRGQNPDL